MSRELKTWEDTETFDDIVIEASREIISALERKLKKEDWCPYLKKEGKYFYYCGTNVPEEIKDKKPNPGHPIYTASVDTLELQLYCMTSYLQCCTFKDKLKEKTEKP